MSVTEDLSAALNRILSDPQSMNQIRNLMGSMGLTGSETSSNLPGASAPAAPIPTAPAAPAAPAAPPAPEPRQEAPASLWGGPENSPGGGEMLAAVMRFAPLLEELHREDDSTRLLLALRPLLSAPRQQKLDEALRFLRLFRLVPLLKESGLAGALPGA